MNIQEQDVQRALQAVVNPDSGRPLLDAARLKSLRIQGADVSVEIELGYPARSQHTALQQTLAAAVQALPGAGRVQVAVGTQVLAHSAQRGLPPLPQVKNIIAVASGKGGVGKSTTAANLALALAHEGARVGVLDADIYGPSQPIMLGVQGRPESRDGKSMEPMEGHGLQVSSIGFLVDPDQAMVWRGPMATQALDQLLRQTNWHALDYLVVDLPPGTGDIQLSLSQRVPLSGAVIVTTPQDIALADARKAVTMFEKVGVPILGLVENMAVHVCSQCGHAEHIFGADGGRRYAAEKGLDYLGALPLALSIREQADSGRPSVVAEPDGEVAATYRHMARQLAARLALRAQDPSGQLPTITISRDT